MATVHHIDTIVSDPALHRGQPVIAGTHIRVIDVVASHLYRGAIPEELALDFALDLGQVYAVLAYYYQHKADIDALIHAEAETADHLLETLNAQGKLIRFG